MSRLKNFPNKVSIGMRANGELVLLPEKADWGFFTTEQIRKVESYCLPSAQATPKPKRKKKPESELVTFKCNKCNRTYQYGKEKGKGVQCECGKGVLVQPEKLPESAKPTGDEDKKTEDVASEPESKTDFRCNACGRDVDNPKTAGNGKIQCPYCLEIGTVIGKE